MSTTTTKTRTITLTGRRPVQIRDAEWPVIASGSGDGARYAQALSRGELDRYVLRARQHADGRTIVYAVLDAASCWTGSEDYRGGELLARGADVAEAIERVGRRAGLPASVIRETVADLPAEALDASPEGWNPTHRITFRSADGRRTTTELVMHFGDGAFTASEWAADDGAAWGIADGKWLCEGQPTPRGEPGTVEIETL